MIDLEILAPIAIIFFAWAILFGTMAALDEKEDEDAKNQAKEDDAWIQEYTQNFLSF